MPILNRSQVTHTLGHALATGLVPHGRRENAEAEKKGLTAQGTRVSIQANATRWQFL